MEGDEQALGTTSEGKDQAVETKEKMKGDEQDETSEEQGNAAESEEEEEKAIFRWWNVTREAETCGSLRDYAIKGKARRNSSRTVSFDWLFQPTSNTVATLSPRFEWLDLSWSLRFQKSPFESGILHPPAWSIFLDLFPPYQKIHHVTGTICLLDGDTSIGRAWKLDEIFAPAAKEQEICTWCRHRLDLDDFVSQMNGKDICIRVKLSVWGLGQDFRLEPMRKDHETLPFTLKVGTTTVARRFGWNLRKHLNTMPEDQIRYWKKLRDDPKGRKKLKFSPRDIVALVQSDHMVGLAKWEACRELKKFFVQAIHLAEHGVAFIPYHLVFFDFDLMDLSDFEDDSRKEPHVIELCSFEKHDIIVRILDWMAEIPLTVSYKKACGEEDETRTDLLTAQARDYHLAQVKAGNEQVICSSCSTTGLYKELKRCSLCLTQNYCNKKCQRRHWKVHKRQCERLGEDRKAKRKEEKALEAKVEEKKAGELMDECIDRTALQMFKAIQGKQRGFRFGNRLGKGSTTAKPVDGDDSIS